MHPISVGFTDTSVEHWGPERECYNIIYSQYLPPSPVPPDLQVCEPEGGERKLRVSVGEGRTQREGVE